MAQQKGHTGNPNGRPKGTPNKLTTTVRSWIVELINDNRGQIEKDLQCLKPVERLTFIERLLPYILPKVERADEVEGAAFTKDDVVSTPLLPDWETTKEARRVQQWMEKDG